MSTTVTSYQNNTRTQPANNNGYKKKNVKSFKKGQRKTVPVITAENFYFENASGHAGFGFVDGECLSVLRGLLLLRIACCAVVVEEEDLYVEQLPQFEFELGELMRRIEGYLGLKGIQTYLGGCRIVGSAAQSVLLNEDCEIKEMNDLDLSFYISGDPSQKFPDVCRAMQELVVGFIAENQQYVSYEDVSKYYLKDFNWIENERDTWCLCSLGNADFTVDIKFIWTLQRRFTFSLNSFEVIVDDLLHQHNVTRVPAECSFGDYQLALTHLQNQILYTQNPEMIFRGCLRYCLQLAKGSTPKEENKSYFDYAFSRNFWSTFGWGSTNYFRKIVKRFLEHHPRDKIAFLQHLHHLISDGENLGKDDFLDVVETFQREISQGKEEAH